MDFVVWKSHCTLSGSGIVDLPGGLTILRNFFRYVERDSFVMELISSKIKVCAVKN